MQERNSRRTKSGLVIRKKTDKTAIVEVETMFRHPVYGKVMKMATKFVVHDEENKAKPGDKVEIEETRPISKTKRWRILETAESKGINK